jgi:hypothetical protein
VSTTRPERLLAAKLRSLSPDLIRILPDLEKVINYVETTDEPKLLQMQRIHQQQKEVDLKTTTFDVVNLVSGDKKETIAVPEQIILYALAKRLMKRDVLTAEQRKLAFKVMTEVGIYSFDWLCLQSRALIKIVEDNQATGDKSDVALKAMHIINQQLQRFFWLPGYAKSALNQCEIAAILAQHNVDNQFRDSLEASQQLIYERTLCAKGLLDDPYAQQVLGMFVKDKQLKHLFSDPAAIPDDNTAALDILRLAMKNNLAEKQIDVFSAESRAKRELALLEPVLQDITEHALALVPEQKSTSTVDKHTLFSSAQSSPQQANSPLQETKLPLSRFEK